MSRIRGTRRIQEVTGGHERDPIQVQEEPRGYHRTREDTALARFGTVRHQMPLEIKVCECVGMISSPSNTPGWIRIVGT